MTAPLPKAPRADFLTALEALGAELRADRRAEDRAHFGRIERVGLLLAAVGLATAWVGINPLSVLALALASFIRWTIVGHHVLHGAFDRDPEAPARWRSSRFGKGWRRYVDWLDWLPPAAWRYEHNTLHHHRLGESHDPDVPEEALAWLRESGLPRWMNLLIVAPSAAVWRGLYYGPQAVRQVCAKARREALPRFHPFRLAQIAPWTPLGRAVWRESWLPVILGRFVFWPLVFLPVGMALGMGAHASVAVLVNLVLAELIAGVHSFVIITPSHAGADLYRFETKPRGRAELLARQLLGTANYRTGGAVNDVLHGYLNYQIEHHLWPDLAPAQLMRAQPRLKALCAAHGVPYVQEGVFTRLGKLLDNAVGDERMTRLERALDPADERGAAR